MWSQLQSIHQELLDDKEQPIQSLLRLHNFIRIHVVVVIVVYVNVTAVGLAPLSIILASE